MNDFMLKRLASNKQYKIISTIIRELRHCYLREFKKRTAFMKPSIENRMSRLKAQRRQHRATLEQE